jgi:hypothetical protein
MDHMRRRQMLWCHWRTGKVWLAEILEHALAVRRHARAPAPLAEQLDLPA